MKLAIYKERIHAEENEFVVDSYVQEGKTAIEVALEIDNINRGKDPVLSGMLLVDCPVEEKIIDEKASFDAEHNRLCYAGKSYPAWRV